MLHLDRTNDRVRRHLQGGTHFTPNGLTIVTEPGPDGRAVTMVRQSMNGHDWSHTYAERLADRLSELQGASVTLSPVRNRITVIWDGVQ